MYDESPWPWLVIGVVVAGVGVVLTNVEDMEIVSGLALLVGLLLSAISSVALGVSWGMAHHARRRP